MDHDDIIALVLAALGFLGGVWAVVSSWIKARAQAHEVDHTSDIEQRRITNDFIASLEKRIDQLLSRVDTIEKKSDQQDLEIDRLREQLRLKDARIVELERTVSERELKIDELETEVADLRSRLEIVEKRKARGKTE